MFAAIPTACALILAAAAGDASIRVDLNPDNGRGDVVTQGRENWPFNPTHPSREFAGVAVAFRSQSPLVVRWYKPLLAYGATQASDGVAASGSLEIVLTGLKPGPHTLATFHNRLEEGPVPSYDVSVAGKPLVNGLTPTTRIHDDADAACAFIEFTAGAEPTVVTITAKGGDGEVIVNGLEIDSSDPNHRAIKPSPFNGDSHVDAESGSALLSWTSREPAARHRIYFGADRAAVEAAEPSSPEFRGESTTATSRAEGLSSHRDAFWRVDEISPTGAVTRGDVWSFRPRHLAFPGAEGYGRFARGGRGGRVIEVVNLDDSGPGSFRAAAEAQGPRTVVFRVSGVIRLRSAVSVRNSYLTVAGETAPGDGICFRGYMVGTAPSSSDVIMRHIRVRPGDESNHSVDGMGLGGDHTIFDHCSVSWSIDEGLDSRSARNSTFQRCMISEALNDSFQRHPHSYAGSIGGNLVSYHHNLLAHCAGRNWSLAGGYDQAVRFAGHMDIRNNVVYNWEHRTTDGGAKRVNFVNNYYKPGPATRVFHLVKPDVGSESDRQVYYIAGNFMEGRPSYDDDNWKGVTPNGTAPLAEFRSDQPLFPSYVTTTSAAEAYRDVLADVGATHPRQDSLDRRVIEETRTGTVSLRGSKTGLPGIIDVPGDVGPSPWPDYQTRDVPVDSDHDGLPDEWERRHGRNPSSPAGDFSDSNADPDGDGYTLLEDYLHELASQP
ncbi:pectate lyase family protein [Paludisphaera rhizosphaerae]|uniref:pectate lyase family protein n=1 Tax=Paludisphaera rhizosphaerae TaxID=2711216 RepID=UPI0013EE3ACD|nr:T9SS C-terminal target domain-containing protein [Paludisphaera rhizosphaerae]